MALNINCGDVSIDDIPESGVPCSDDDIILPAQLDELYYSSSLLIDQWSREQLVIRAFLRITY